MLACERGHVQAVEALSKFGGLQARGSSGATALMIASGRCEVECVRALLAQGANPKARDVHGWNSLIHAILAMKERGPSIVEQDWSEADARRRLECMGILLDACGAGAKDWDDGRTVLMLEAGAKHGCHESLSMVMSRCSDSDLEAKEGVWRRTAADIARSLGSPAADAIEDEIVRRKRAPYEDCAPSESTSRGRPGL